MKELEALVQDGDLEGMALQLEAMKRLWEGRGLDGLLLRRDKEAALVRSAKRVYLPGELVLV
jgi:GH24 family phage-related lysozyme (muramidase)